MPSADSAAPTDLFHGRRYHAYNDWVKREHGGRLQKVSIDAGFTCPNRDGSLGVGGCSFCNNEGFTPSYLREQRDIHQQIDTGIAFMRRRVRTVGLREKRCSSDQEQRLFSSS